MPSTDVRRRDAATNPEPAVRITSLSKTYAGNQALSDVSIQIMPGQIHALAGQNGAGKSTLIRILAGVERYESGTIDVAGGRSTHTGGEHDQAIGFVHQDLGLIDSLSVAENIGLTNGYQTQGSIIRWAALRRHCEAVFRDLDYHIDPRIAVGELSVSERTIVAIARVMAMQHQVIVLDEPTATMSTAEVSHLFAILRGLRDKGVAILYVTHRLDEIYDLTDRVTVLRDGVVVRDGATSEIPMTDLVSAITGRRARAQFPPKLVQTSRTEALSVRGLRIGPLGPHDITLHRGEILGLVGLRGAGHEEVGRAVAGVNAPDAGVLTTIDGQFVARNVSAALRNGIGFISGRRADEGVAVNLSIRENLMLNPKWTGEKYLRWFRTDRRRARQLVEQYDIRPAETERPVGTLSGGNQQKVVMGRWMNSGTPVLIVEEPTAGVDVGARFEIYSAIIAHCAGGGSCILVSSDTDEVAGLAHRCMVFDRGRIVKQLSGEDVSTVNVSRYASGESR